MRAAADSAPGCRLYGFSPGETSNSGLQTQPALRSDPAWLVGGLGNSLQARALGRPRVCSRCRSRQAPTQQPFSARGPGKSSVPVMCGCASRCRSTSRALILNPPFLMMSTEVRPLIQ